MRIRMEGNLSGRCLSGEPQLCCDPEVDARVDSTACARVGIRSMVVVPLPFQGDTFGILKVSSTREGRFDEADLTTAQLLVGPVAYGIASAAQAEAARARDDVARRFQATFDQAAVEIAHVAPDGRFLRVNDRFCQVAVYSRSDLCEGGFQQITRPDDLNADLEQFAALSEGRIDHYQLEKRYVRMNGDIVWVNLTVSMVSEEAGTPSFLVAVIENISKRKAAESLAAYNTLTGLSLIGARCGGVSLNCSPPSPPRQSR